MKLENIILSEVSQVQKAKGCIFFLTCGKQAQYKIKQHYIHIEIYTEHVSKSGTGRDYQGKRKRRKER
jgi:hypothetical protein